MHIKTANKLKNKYKKIAALDVDGVILDWAESFRLQAEEMLGRKISTVGEFWNTCKRFNISKDEFNKVWNNFDWGHLKPFEGAIESISNLQKQGYFVVLITSISPEIEQSRKKSLKSYGCLPGHMFCVGFNESKQHLLEILQPEMYIDDKASHINEAVNAGVPKIFHVDYGYIYDEATPSIEKGVAQVKSLKEACNILLKTPS